MRKKLVDLSEDLSGQAAKQTNSAVLRVSESLLDDSTLSTVPRNQLENVRQLEDRFGAVRDSMPQITCDRLILGG